MVLHYSSVWSPYCVIFPNYYQGLWFDRDSHLWMLPHMTDDLISLLHKSGISNLQQLLVLSKQNLQSVVGNSNASRLYQVRVNLVFLVFFVYQFTKVSLLHVNSSRDSIHFYCNFMTILDILLQSQLKAHHLVSNFCTLCLNIGVGMITKRRY